MRKKGYSIIVNWSDEENCFVAQSLGKTGCISKGKSVSAAVMDVQSTVIKKVRLTAVWQKS